MNFNKKGELFPFLFLSIIIHIFIIIYLIKYSLQKTISLSPNNQINIIIIKKQTHQHILNHNPKEINLPSKTNLTKNKKNLKNTIPHKIIKPLNTTKSTPKPLKQPIKTIPIKKLIKKIKPTLSIKKTQAKPANTDDIEIQKTKKITKINNLNNQTKVNIKEETKKNFLINYKEQIINLLSKKIKYPYIARKRGYEGYFLIELTIDNKGKLLSHKFIKANGKKILKKSALKTINKLQFPKHNFDKIKITIPIVFKLKKGA